MGYDISQARYEKLERNRRDGRLCGGATMARAGCSIRATVKLTEETWIYRVGEGTPRITTMTVCTRHARQTPVGFEGVNFRVTGMETF